LLILVFVVIYLYIYLNAFKRKFGRPIFWKVPRNERSIELS